MSIRCLRVATEAIWGYLYKFNLPDNFCVYKEDPPVPNQSLIALSGLKAQQMHQNVSAHNTANVHTDGFSRHRVRSSERPAGGVQSTVDTVELSPEAQQTSPSLQGPQNNVDPVIETVDRPESAAAFSANARTLRTQDRLHASVLDLFA